MTDKIGIVTGRSGGEYRMEDRYIKKIIPNNYMYKLWFPLVDGGWIHRDGIEALIPSKQTQVEFKVPEDPSHRPKEEPPDQKEKVQEDEAKKTHMEFDTFMELCRKHDFMHTNGRVNKEALETASGLPPMTIRRAIQEKEVSKSLADYLQGLNREE